MDSFVLQTNKQKRVAGKGFFFGVCVHKNCKSHMAKVKIGQRDFSKMMKNKFYFT